MRRKTQSNTITNPSIHPTRGARKRKVDTLAVERPAESMAERRPWVLCVCV